MIRSLAWTDCFRAVVFDDQREVELDRFPQHAVASVHVRHAE